MKAQEICMTSQRKEKLDTFHQKQFYVEMEHHSYVLPIINVSGPAYILSKNIYIIWRNRCVFIQMWVKKFENKKEDAMNTQRPDEFQFSSVLAVLAASSAL